MDKSINLHNTIVICVKLNKHENMKEIKQLMSIQNTFIEHLNAKENIYIKSPKKDNKKKYSLTKYKHRNQYNETFHTK